MSELRERIAEIISDYTIDYQGIPSDGGEAAWYIAGRILALLNDRDDCPTCRKLIGATLAELDEGPEPVAWAWYTDDDERWRFNSEGKKPEAHEHPTNKHLVPLYASPVASAPQGYVVATRHGEIESCALRTYEDAVDEVGILDREGIRRRSELRILPVGASPVASAPESKQGLPYPEDQGRTHWEGCWRERGHHNCAVVEIERLRAPDRASEPTEAEAPKCALCGEVCPAIREREIARRTPGGFVRWGIVEKNVHKVIDDLFRIPTESHEGEEPK